MIHPTHCRNAPPTASDAEMRELARRLECGNERGPKHIVSGTREADIVIDALRRMSGRE